MKTFSALMLSLAILPALAAPRTATLSVSGMTCAACPITVKKALTRVPGVTKAEVDLDQRRAVVTYDDARTTPADLARAVSEAGYPAQVVAK
ncbi:MAG: mercury resistance system periplasmic binding protein MerP [Thiobacillaceae bacterium]